jgi:hypothetical protein
VAEAVYSILPILIVNFSRCYICGSCTFWCRGVNKVNRPKEGPCSVTFNGHSRNDNAVGSSCRYGNLKRKLLLPSASVLGFKGRIQSQRNVFALEDAWRRLVVTYRCFGMHRQKPEISHYLKEYALSPCSTATVQPDFREIYKKFPQSISFFVRVWFVIFINGLASV